MKKTMLALVLAFALLLPQAAWGMVKGADILSSNGMAKEEDMLTGIEGSFVYEGKLYLMAYQETTNLFHWSSETGELEKMPMDNEEYPGGLQILSDGKNLYQFSQWEGKLYPATLSEKGLERGTEIPFDNKPLTSEENNGQLNINIFSSILADGSLYILAQQYEETDYMLRNLYRIDLTSGQTEVVFSGKGLMSIAGYRDGNLIALMFDQDQYYQNYNYDSGKSDPSLLPRAVVVNTQTRAIEETLLTFPAAEVGGLTYDAPNDLLYFATQDGVYRARPQGESELVNYLPISHYNNDLKGSMVGSEYYTVSTYSEVYIRSTDPNDKPATSLRVKGASFDWEGRAGYSAFTKKHPDVAVIADNSRYLSTPEAIYQDLITDTASDIYTLYEAAGLQTLIKKGYAADLSQSTVLADAIGQLYPHMTANLYQDGKLYGIPYSVNLQGQSAYSPSVLKEIGLTPDDLPKTLIEFVDFIIDWVDDYSLDNPQLDLFENQWQSTQQMLYSMVFMQQITYCTKMGIPFTFDTPEVVAILKKIESSASILKDLDPDEDVMNYFVSYDDKPKALISNDFYLFDSYRGLNYDYVPLSLSLYEGTPFVNALSMQVLFVNPKSKNMDLALSLLEELTLNMMKKQQILLNPNENEPIENPWYEQNKEYQERYLKDLKQTIENIQDESQKKMLEEQLASSDEWALELERDRYEVSQAQIDTYRGMAENVMPPDSSYTMIYSSADLQNLVTRMMDGQLPAEQFVRETEKILRKMRLEAN